MEAAFAYVGLDWRDHVKIDPRYFRPTEVDVLQADPSKAGKTLGWQPKVTFGELIKIMVDADIEAIGLTPPGEGKKILEEKFAGWHRWETGVTALCTNDRQGME